MLTHPTMYSPLLGNAGGKFYLQSDHSITNRRSSIEMHILNLSDGTPYCAPPSNVIKWAIPPSDPLIKSVQDVVITSSRIMLHISGPRRPHTPSQKWCISVWDWKTGNPVIVP